MKTMRITCMTLLLGLTALATNVSAEEARSPAPAYRIIVHPKNPASSVERTFLRDAFLKKTTRWPHDRVIHPADLASSSAARVRLDRKSTRLNSSHLVISYAVFCLKKKNKINLTREATHVGTTTGAKSSM